MSRQLDDPEFPVCGWFLTIMAGLEAVPKTLQRIFKLRATPG